MKTIAELKEELIKEYCNTKLPHPLQSEIRYNRIKYSLKKFRESNPLECSVIENIDDRIKSISIKLTTGFNSALRFDTRNYIWIFTRLTANNLIVAVNQIINQLMSSVANMSLSESFTLIVKDDGSIIDKNKESVFQNPDLIEFWEVLKRANIITNDNKMHDSVWR